MQAITDTWSIMVRPTLWHACDGEGGELMPILFVRDGMHALHGDILLKQALASVSFGCIGVAPPSNSSVSMHMVFLGATELETR